MRLDGIQFMRSRIRDPGTILYLGLDLAQLV